jgi:hypothetical protein
VNFEAEEVLALDEALLATVVVLDVAADEVLTEVVSEALRVLAATVPDADETDDPAVTVPSDPDVDEPEDPVLAVFQ